MVHLCRDLAQKSFADVFGGDLVQRSLKEALYGKLLLRAPCSENSCIEKSILTCQNIVWGL